MQNLNVLVLAAGRSTRIRSAHPGPKPLLELQGSSVLERDLRWLAHFGVKAVWINLHYRAEEIQGRIGDGQQFGLQVSYSFEPRLLGTAGALNPLGLTQGTTLVVYGDNLVSFDLHHFLEHHRQHGADASLALFDPSIHPHTGIAGGRVGLGPTGQIERFEERDSVDQLVNAGVYLLEPTVLAAIPPGEYDFGRQLFPQLLEARRHLQGYLINGYCLGLDTPESLAQARQLIDSGQVVLS